MTPPSRLVLTAAVVVGAIAFARLLVAGLVSEDLEVASAHAAAVSVAAGMLLVILPYWLYGLGQAAKTLNDKSDELLAEVDALIGIVERELEQAEARTNAVRSNDSGTGILRRGIRLTDVIRFVFVHRVFAWYVTWGTGLVLLVVSGSLAWAQYVMSSAGIHAIYAVPWLVVIILAVVGLFASSLLVFPALGLYLISENLLSRERAMLRRVRRVNARLDSLEIEVTSAGRESLDEARSAVESRDALTLTYRVALRNVDRLTGLASSVSAHSGH